MSVIQKEFDISVGTGIISAFERIDIENYQIFSEFIDNSLQSFLDHKEILINKLHVPKCIVNITWTNDEIVITDNAFGMNEDGFHRALQLNRPADSYSQNSLSKYGIGLKYAAANLGDYYEIESTEYGSHLKYRGKIDINYWREKNPTSMLVDIVDDFVLEKHFTVIKILKLKHRYDDKETKKTIKNLAIIYSHFIEQTKELEIIVNGQKVQYVDPDLYVDENGSEAMESINKKFFFEGKQYEFVGWIGVLNKGSTGDAGLNLIQNNRVIELRYRPKEIFGNVNDFTYQRIVGEIQFVGENWEVRINKDGMVWKGNGLREKFAEVFSKMPEFERIKKIADSRRVRNTKRKIKIETQNVNYSGFDKSEYDVNEKVCFSATPREGYTLKSVKVNNNELTSTNTEGTNFDFTVGDKMPKTILVKLSAELIKKAKQNNVSSSANEETVVNINTDNPRKTLTFAEKIEKHFKGLKRMRVSGQNIIQEPLLYEGGIRIDYSNTSYKFEIEEIYQNRDCKWIEIKEIPAFQNSYKIIVNHNAGFLRDMEKNEDLKIANICLCITIALSRITGISSGINLNNSQIIVDKINAVLNNCEE